MDLRGKPDIKISEHCEKHDSKEIVSWCPVHDVGVCSECQENDHSDCDGLESLSEIVSIAQLNSDFKTLKVKFGNIRKIYKKLQREREGNIESVKTQKVQIRDEIRKLRENLNYHLIELENKLISELDKTCEKYATNLSGEITDYKYRNAILDSHDDESAKAKEYGSNLQIILAAKKGMAIVKHEVEHLTKLNETIRNYSVEFKLAEAIKDVLNIKSLGSVETIEANAYVNLEMLNINPFLPSIKTVKPKITVENKEDHRWHRTRLKRSKEFNMNTSLDKFLPEVSGAAFMPDESIILADTAHKRLLHVKDKGQIFQEVSLPFEPFDVAVLGNSKLFISILNDRRVEVRDINSMEQIDELILPSNASGLNAFEDSLLVVVCEKTGLYLVGSDNSINIISMKHNDEGPVDINAETISYAETKKCLVHSYTHGGKRKFTLKVDGFGYIHGIALLKDSSILVAKLSPGRHSITHISQDGKDKMLRLELNEIASPRSLAVHRKKRKLLLVHGVRKISIFQEL
ncbi:unnamed protein product [Mytilus coruscus]|uniref:B box-type domain-containing protein n=1 Tax=Mytilus coruscus TaxID=42192 RepID=A0A6J8EI14_MYTCO|nr:unnamed protein product [Mytilus coruscus]